MNKLIITADDFGVYPSINAGITKAVQSGKVNSVAALSNHDLSVENTLELLDATDGDVDIGCHLTFTSGKPLFDEGKQMFSGDYFPPFTEFIKYDTELVKAEINAQIDQFIDNDIPVNHLSSHHDILTLFKDHFDLLMSISRARGIPMRSPNVDPTSNRDSLYRYIVRSALIDDVSYRTRREITRFGSEIHHYFLRNDTGIKAPDMLDSRHYGPIPMIPISERRRDKLVKRKHDDLDDFFDYYENTIYDTMELVVHLIDESTSMDSDIDYPGINVNYFDSRSVEFASILAYDFDRHEQFKMSSWREL